MRDDVCKSGGGRAKVVAVAVPFGKFGDVAVDAAGDGEKLVGGGVFQPSEVLVLELAHVEQARVGPFLAKREQSRSKRVMSVRMCKWIKPGGQGWVSMGKD